MIKFVLVEFYGERRIILGYFNTRYEAFKEMMKYEEITESIGGVSYEIIKVDMEQ